jgi:hypothetical protein
MRTRLAVFALLLLATPLAALAATAATPAAPSQDPAPATGAPAAGTAQLASAPLLDLVAHPGVAQAGCGSFTRCVTVADCPCASPDCACVPSSTCGFHICLCRTYCFGGDPP